MNNPHPSFRFGTRGSRLALLQARDAVQRLQAWLPDVAFELAPVTTPGDRDRTTDLRTSPPDFFTRDLDEAVLAGRLDGAIHSAKDLPDPMPAGLDWCWLPWRDDPRDAWVLPRGKTWAGLPAAPRIGISSVRRETYALKRFPQAVMMPLRGNIEERLARLDAGDFDLLLMAGAALKRLGLAERISEWVEGAELPTPDGQGALALTFRENDPRLLRLRALLVRAVVFLGAGAGGAEACTLAGLRALERCEVCLHDALMDPALLERLPPDALRVDVGKRCGRHAAAQDEINQLLAMYARRGLRVVRLKGGDPGIFGRLAEEIETLDRLRLSYRVLPGIGSLQAATTGTGMLLTRRGVSRGFCVMTPRAQGGGTGPVNAAARAKLPVVFFMGAGMTAPMARELLQDGWAPDMPAAMVYDAGGEDEKVVRATLKEFSDKENIEHPPSLRSYGGTSPSADITHHPPPTTPSSSAPGLFIAGEIVRHAYVRDAGALRGRRVLLTCSAALMEKAADLVRDYGGVPLCRPLIRLAHRPEAVRVLAGMGAYQWLVLTSPSAVRCFAGILAGAPAGKLCDLRRLPRVMVCGPGTAAELERLLRVRADYLPAGDFSAASLVREAPGLIGPGMRVLRLRSDKAGGALAEELRRTGAEVTDLEIYRNVTVAQAACPDFDAVFFASASAVDAFVNLWGRERLAGRTILVIGQPTSRALAVHDLRPDVMGFTATVGGAITALAAWETRRALAEEGTIP